MKHGLAVLLFGVFALWIPHALFELRYDWQEKDPKVDVPLDVLDPIAAGLNGLAASKEARPRARQIVFLGDSIIAGPPRGRRVPDRLLELLEAARPGVFDVHAMASPGMGAFDFYFIADRVGELGPDLVVMPVNLASFSASWRNTFPRPELAALLRVRRVPESLVLPVDGIGLTADRLLFYLAIERLGGLYPWRDLTQQQVYLANARRGFAQAVGKRFGGDEDLKFARASIGHFRRQLNLENEPRFSAAGVEERYGTPLRGVEPDDPTLRILASAVRIYREHGAEVLVYANPTNVEHMARVDALGDEGFSRTLEAIRTAVHREGVRFVDLHAALPDTAYKDPAGHLRAGDGVVNGVRILAERLAEAIAPRAFPQRELDALQ